MKIFAVRLYLLDEETGKPIPGALVIVVAKVDYEPLREGPYNRAVAAARGGTNTGGMLKFGKLEGLWFGEEPKDKLWKLLESRKPKVKRRVLGVECGSLLVFAPKYGFMHQPFGIQDNPAFQKEVQGNPKGYIGLYGWPLGSENREPVLLDSTSLRKGTVVVLKMKKPDDPKTAYKDFRVRMLACLIAGLTKNTGATVKEKERIYDFFVDQINEATGLFEGPFFVQQYYKFQKPEFRNAVINWRLGDENEDSTVQAWLAQKAMEILPEECKEVKEYSQSILEGLTAEGEEERTRNHFYDPNDPEKAFAKGQTALRWGAVGYPENPGNEWDWADAQRYYREGDRTKAYQALGHVLRLLDNLAVPKYTQMNPEKDTEFEKHIENLLEDNAGNLPPEYWMKAREASAAKTLKERFEDVARRTAELEALDKREARMQGGSVVNGYMGGIWEAMAKKSFPPAIAQGAGLLRDFHKLMHPAAFVQFPPRNGGDGKEKPRQEVKESTTTERGEVIAAKQWMPELNRFRTWIDPLNVREQRCLGGGLPRPGPTWHHLLLLSGRHAKRQQ
ncbi:MAG: hypothetical protein HY922_03910 [Elusimicrobia bacterium]|nr:hypothetical protein [Elusimicrobiota bacterium]